MSNNLNVINFDENKKRYQFDGLEFTLKPPYMSIVNQAAPLIQAVEETSKNLKGFDNEEFWKLAETQIQLLRLILDETEIGKLHNLTADRLRPDVVKRIFQDFFSQFNG